MPIPATRIDDLTGGWNPSVDAYNAPPNCLVRADNLTWEQGNVPRLRAGSVKINATTYGPAVNGLYTTILNGNRVRMAGAGSNVYENGTLLAGAFPGDTDIAFGSHMNQILIARGSRKVKWDGSIARNWGIASPPAAPTVAESVGNVKQIASCDLAETWTADTSEGAVTDVPGRTGAANTAKRITPNATSFRGVMSTAFAVKDLNDYSGEAGSDTDLVEFYIKVIGSNLLTSLQLQIDVNGASSAPFQDDYYQVLIDLSSGVKVALTPSEALSPTDAEGFERDRVRADLRRYQDGGNDTGDTAPTSRVGRAASWVRYSIPRGKMERVGTTSGKGWSTAVGVRLIAQFSAVGGTVDLDYVTISGGISHALTGKYQARAIYVYNSGTYQGKSGISETSAQVDLRGGALSVTVAPSTDSQVNETWVFIMGGGLNTFYRGAVMTTNGGTVSIGTPEVTLAILNITLENNSPPPDGIIGIVGPHAGRTWVLTATQLCPSRRNNPDSFDLTQAVTVGDTSETPYWVVLTSEGNLFVGTSKGVYRIGGKGLEFPDGTTDISKDSISIEPPIDYGATTDGYVIYYIASDGWRAYAGGVSRRIVGTLDELYKGYERYGIKSVNLGSGHARFRCATFNGKLLTLSGEGIAGNDEYSPALHVFDPQSPVRERRLYPFNITVLYREPDGGLLVGCTDGFVREIEVGTDDDGALIPFTAWTPIYFGGTPLNYKDPYGMEALSDTGNTTVSMALHVDSSETAAATVSWASDVFQAIARRLDTLTPFRAIQARITGAANRFILREFSFNYRLRPQRRLYADTGYVDTGRNFTTWVRRIRVKARIKAPLTVLAYFDDVAFTAYTAGSSPIDKVTHFIVPVPKNFKGRQPRVVIYASDNTSNAPAAPGQMRIDEFSRLPSTADLDAAERMRFATVGFSMPAAVNPETDNSFECYWVEFDFEPTGNQNEAKPLRVQIG